jgi:integrase
VQALFDAADGLVDGIRARHCKGALAAMRDAALLKTFYAFGLRRREAWGLDLADLRHNPKIPAFGRYGGLFIRWGQILAWQSDDQPIGSFDRGNPARRCTPHTKNGEQYLHWARRGTNVCDFHGAKAPQVKRTARIRLEMAACSLSDSSTIVHAAHTSTGTR